MSKETVALEAPDNKDNRINHKKNAIAFVLFAVVLCSTVFISKAFMDSKYIGEEKAKEIALFHANSSYENVDEYRCKMDLNDDGDVVYKIFFSTSKGVYDFVLDGKSGELLTYNFAEYGQQITEDNIS